MGIGMGWYWTLSGREVRERCRSRELSRATSRCAPFASLLICHRTHRCHHLVQVGNPLQPYPFHSSPTFSLSTSQSALYASSSSLRKPLGGTDLFVSIDRISVPGTLKSDVSGVVELEKKVGKHGDLPVWFVGTQADGAKAYVSAIWTKFE